MRKRSPRASFGIGWLLGGAAFAALAIACLPDPVRGQSANPNSPFGHYLSRDDAFTEGDIEMEQSDGARCIQIQRHSDTDWELRRC